MGWKGCFGAHQRGTEEERADEGSGRLPQIIRPKTWLIEMKASGVIHMLSRVA